MGGGGSKRSLSLIPTTVLVVLSLGFGLLLGCDNNNSLLHFSKRWQQRLLKGLIYMCMMYEINSNHDKTKVEAEQYVFEHFHRTNGLTNRKSSLLMVCSLSTILILEIPEFPCPTGPKVTCEAFMDR